MIVVNGGAGGAIVSGNRILEHAPALEESAKALASTYQLPVGLNKNLYICFAHTASHVCIRHQFLDLINCVRSTLQAC